MWGLAAQGSMGELAEEAAGDDQAAESASADAETPSLRAGGGWPPGPLVRTSRARTHDSDTLGPMVAAEAQARNFDRAERKVFVGDGGKWIW